MSDDGFVGCQRHMAVIDGIPVWCGEAEHHLGGCMWPYIPDNPATVRHMGTVIFGPDSAARVTGVDDVGNAVFHMEERRKKRRML